MTVRPHLRRRAAIGLTTAALLAGGAAALPLTASADAASTHRDASRVEKSRSLGATRHPRLLDPGRPGVPDAATGPRPIDISVEVYNSEMI